VTEHEPHFHKAPDGRLVQCYHATKSLLGTYQFWIGLTIGYPLEHALWEHVWPFKLLTELMSGH
jgi:hypothetical protein